MPNDETRSDRKLLLTLRITPSGMMMGNAERYCEKETNRAVRLLETADIINFEVLSMRWIAPGEETNDAQ